MKIMFVVLLSLVFVSCARANYTDPPSDANPNGSPSSTCGLKFQKSGLCVAWKWESKPTESDPGTFRFEIYRLDSSNKSILEDPTSAPSALLWMPSMGHGSSPVQIQKIDVGDYRANSVYFVMPGEWEIKFQIKSGSTVVDEAVDRVTI